MESVNPPNHMVLLLMMLAVLEVLWRITDEMWNGDGEQCERKGGVKFEIQLVLLIIYNISLNIRLFLEIIINVLQ